MKKCEYCAHFRQNGEAISCVARSVRWGVDMHPNAWCFDERKTPTKESKPHKMRDAHREAVIKELYKTTTPVSEIAERLGMSLFAVYLVANRMGLRRK